MKSLTLSTMAKARIKGLFRDDNVLNIAKEFGAPIAALAPDSIKGQTNAARRPTEHGTLCDCAFDKASNPLDLPGANDRPYLGGLVARITDIARIRGSNSQTALTALTALTATLRTNRN